MYASLLLTLALTVGAAPAEVGTVVDELDARIWCIRQVRGGELWFGSNGGGAYRYDGRALTRYTEADGLVGMQVRDIRADARGGVLVATHTGVARFDGERWAALEVVDLPAGEGWVLDPDDTWLVVGSGTGGPCRYDGERVLRLTLPKSPAEDAHRARFPDASYPPDGVYALHRDRAGHVWIGTAVVGLCRFDGEGFAWLVEERLTTTPSGGSFGIRSMHHDRDGRLWVCNTRQRFDVAREPVEEGGFPRLAVTREPGLPDAAADTSPDFTYAFTFAEGDDGALWMACGDDGVWRYADGSVTRFEVGDGAFVMALLLDDAGRLWAGTVEQGVHVLDGERFVPFTLE